MKLGFRFFMASAGVTALALFATEVSAQVKQELSGHARTRMVFNDNGFGANSDSSEFWENRVRLNIDVMPSNGLQMRIAPQFKHTWGQAASHEFIAREAWMSYSPNKDMSLTLGRQAVALGNNRHFGTDMWNQDSIVHDAARLNFGFGSGNASLIYTKSFEGNTTPSSDHDNYILYTTWNKVGPFSAMDVWGAWFDRKASAVASVNRTRFATVGVRVAGNFGNADADIEGVYQHGKDNGDNKRGYSLDAQVGWSFDGHRVGLLGYYSNSEKSRLFGDKHRLTPRSRRILGDAQAFSEDQKNLMAGGVVSNFGISKEFDLSLDGYLFMAADKAKAVIGTAVPQGKNLGMEVDFVASYKPTNMFSYDAGYALFRSSELKADKVMAHRFYLQAAMTF